MSSANSSKKQGHDESSVLFNLRELMHLESERVHQEAEAQAQALAEERRRLEEAERKLHEERAERERAEEEARARLAAQAREAEESQVRLKQEGELRIRLDAERAARLAQQELELKHARELAALEAAQKKGISPIAAIAVVALLVGGGVAAVAMLVSSERAPLPAVVTATRVEATPRTPTPPALVQQNATAPEHAQAPRPVSRPTRPHRPRPQRPTPQSSATQGLDSLVNDGPIDVLDGVEDRSSRRRPR